MFILETKKQLTLNELLRIAYEYGNSNANMPTDNESVDTEFREWIESSNHLFEKLTLHKVNSCYCMYCEKKLKNSEAIVLCKKCTE